MFEKFEKSMDFEIFKEFEKFEDSEVFEDDTNQGSELLSKILQTNARHQKATITSLSSKTTITSLF